MLPPEEVNRLAALDRYLILDTPPEPAFDALTRVASLVLGVPIALISFIDDERQWFKSRIGLDAAETPREHSFCTHVVDLRGPMVIDDALKDDRFAQNPFVQGTPFVRFYAGVPLRTADGFVLGTLCAIDQRPRSLEPQQLEALQLLAGQVVAQLEFRREHQTLVESTRELRASQIRRTAMLSSLHDGVVVQDNKGAIVTANPAAERILGLTLDQLMGRTSVDPNWRSVHEDGSPFPGESHPAMVALKTGKPVTNVTMGVHKPTGQLTWIRVNSTPIPPTDETGTSVVSTFQDITELREAHHRLSRQERLVTVGTLAAGVGHEINNPLAYLMSNVDFTIEELRVIGGGSPTGRLRELVNVLMEAREGAVRIQKIVRGLRTFAREPGGELLPTNVDAAVEVSINMTQHELRPRARVVAKLAPGLLVLADESKLSQVLVNLLANAGQAFPSNEPEKNEVIITSALATNGQVEIVVQDNGPGIAPEHLQRVFDPFFTTKPPNVGTGLGLSICQNIVNELGGELQLSSTRGVGTRVRVSLPEAMPLPSVVAPLSGGPESRARVLIIDDEVPLAAALARALGRHHEVTIVNDSREVLSALLATPSFDVIFCDIRMPHIDGPGLFVKVCALHPGLARRFVFMSGGANDPDAIAFLDRVPNERLAKPFQLDEVRRIVRRFATSGNSPTSS